MSIVVLSGLNVYNPSDSDLLRLVKADRIIWRHRFWKKPKMNAPTYSDEVGEVYNFNVPTEELSAPEIEPKFWEIKNVYWKKSDPLNDELKSSPA